MFMEALFKYTCFTLANINQKYLITLTKKLMAKWKMKDIRHKKSNQTQNEKNSKEKKNIKLKYMKSTKYHYHVLVMKDTY